MLRLITIVLSLSLFLVSCKSLVDATPPNATIATTIEPSYVLPPGSTQTPNVTAVPTNTVSTSPTLNENQKEEYIFSQLDNNGGCDLPCWWGIIPGKALWSDVSTNFAGLGFRSSQIKGTSKFGMGGFALFSINTYSSVVYDVESNVIQSISITVDGALEPEKFQEAYFYYSPDEILKNYGQPSKILLDIPAYGYGDKVGYSFWMFYEHRGFLVVYSGATQRMEPLSICPSFVYDQSKSRIHLYVKSSNFNLSLDVLSNSGHTKAKSFEEATGKSVSEYYYDVESNPANICFTTPSNLWP